MDVIEFLHELRGEIVALTHNDAILLRFQVEANTSDKTVVLEVVSIGNSITPFVWEQSDFGDIEASKTFILTELRSRLGGNSNA